MANLTLEDLLRELESELIPLIEPDEITVRMLAERSGRPFGACKELLDRKVKAGVMTLREVIYKGKRATAYRKVA